MQLCSLTSGNDARVIILPVLREDLLPLHVGSLDLRAVTQTLATRNDH